MPQLYNDVAKNVTKEFNLKFYKTNSFMQSCVYRSIALVCKIDYRQLPAFFYLLLILHNQTVEKKRMIIKNKPNLLDSIVDD